MLKTIPSAKIPEVGYPTSRQKVSCISFLFYLEISAMSPVQVRNNVESCSYSKEKFKLVKWSLLVTLETQTPYFEKSFKVKEDCECNLQGQILDNTCITQNPNNQWINNKKTNDMQKNIKSNNIPHNHHLINCLFIIILKF